MWDFVTGPLKYLSTNLHTPALDVQTYFQS